jgi:two-component system, OmpR family, alkaline phosphatase synthesis response regulator PhoP
MAAMPSTILTVDDESAVTGLIAYHLGRAGHRVVTAATGREALRAVREHNPDLMILDLMLPDLDGFGVCEILRRDPATATLPVIILSAWTSTEARHVGLELGALDYVSKPFSPSQLMERVHRLLDLRPSPTPALSA